MCKEMFEPYPFKAYLKLNTAASSEVINTKYYSDVGRQSSCLHAPFANGGCELKEYGVLFFCLWLQLRQG